MNATQVGPDQLFEIVEAIWTSMIGLPVTAANGEYRVHDAHALTACIQISGMWNGCVLLLPTEAFARRAASLMLDVPEEQIKAVDMLDTVAELCNMIGGGVKSLMPGHCSLSLPTVMQGQNYALRVPKTRLVAALSFACDAEPLEVRVLAETL